MYKLLKSQCNVPDKHGGADLHEPIAEDLDFNAVYQRFSPYVAAVALRLTGDASAVDDIVQDVFFDCFRSIDSIVDFEHARRWLRIVSVRKIRRYLKRRKLLRTFLFSPDRLPDIGVPGLTADERAIMVRLYRILDAVPVNHRLAWTLRYLEGAELCETADACGCSLATVKRWIHDVHIKVTGDDHA